MLDGIEWKQEGGYGEMFLDGLKVWNGVTLWRRELNWKGRNVKRCKWRDVLGVLLHYGGF